MRKKTIIYFASSNKNKLKEIKSILNKLKIKNVELRISPNGFSVNEDGETFLENAYKKASALSEKLKVNAFADDSGIEVFALDKKPGIYSSRYFKNGRGIHQIIEKLKNKKNKKCCFKCAIVVTNAKGKIIFKAQKSWHGEVSNKPKGRNGFGYDPIFLIPKLNKTSAQVSASLKNKLSHRGMAIRSFATWIKGIKLLNP